MQSKLEKKADKKKHFYPIDCKPVHIYSGGGDQNPLLVCKICDRLIDSTKIDKIISSWGGTV